MESLAMRASLAILAVSLSIGCGMHAEAADSRIDQISTTKAIKIAYRTDATPFSFVKDNEAVG
jgi:ABC-type amino acid transport substrate-binding protein